MPTTSTHVLSTSRKHMIGFFVESFGKRCASTVLTATCYWPSSHCILAQKFVSMSGVYKNWIWSSLLWGEGLQGPGPLTGGEVGIPAWPAKDCKGNPGSFRFSVFRGGHVFALNRKLKFSEVTLKWFSFWRVWYFKNCLRCKNKIINSINIQSGYATRTIYPLLCVENLLIRQDFDLYSRECLHFASCFLLEEFFWLFCVVELQESGQTFGLFRSLGPGE